ncbi:MAG: hypothetical protein GXX82_16385 [Syntrophorhabdus sp.]|nr:hypothetical protein [Syntrophorhabdus sp.]
MTEIGGWNKRDEAEKDERLHNVGYARQNPAAACSHVVLVAEQDGGFKIMQCVFAFEKRPDRGVLDDQAGFVQLKKEIRFQPLSVTFEPEETGACGVGPAGGVTPALYPGVFFATRVSPGVAHTI